MQVSACSSVNSLEKQRLYSSSFLEHSDNVGTNVGVAVVVGLTDVVGRIVGANVVGPIVGGALVVGIAVGDIVIEGDPDGAIDIEGDPEGDTDGASDFEGDPDGVIDFEGDPDGANVVGNSDGMAETDGDTDGIAEMLSQFVSQPKRQLMYALISTAQLIGQHEAGTLQRKLPSEQGSNVPISGQSTFTQSIQSSAC
jgi:hypothetical protein